MPALFRLPPVPVAMCEWWLAHCGCAVCLVGGGVLGVAVFCGCLCLGSVGGLAMCEWWLSHWGLFWVFAGVGGWREWLVRWILASWCFSVGSLCASGGWHIGGSEGLFGPGSGLFAGVRFCDVSVGVVMCKRRLTYWGAGIRFGRLCVSGGWHISAPVGASPCTLGV